MPKAAPGRKTLEREIYLPIFAAKEVIVPKNTNPATDAVDPALRAMITIFIFHMVKNSIGAEKA